MAEHKKYVILKNKTKSGLEDMVNEHLDDGWKPLGGVAYNSHDGYYLQAVFKRNELVHERID